MKSPSANPIAQGSNGFSSLAQFLKTCRRDGRLILCLLLALITLLCYWPVTHHKFINFDDQDYITENLHVKTGLTWDNVIWAFRTGHYANWHPLTWISHMADCQLYGLNAGGHHFTNLLFHVANTLLLFLLLNRMTGTLWRSAFVAALFAWHPLHVESVAWASERKDVLSTFFFLLTLGAYAKYVKSKVQSDAASPSSIIPYLLALFLFVLGLMSKPMVVTLPFVLLLLDFWPLRRFQIPAGLFPPFRSVDGGPRTVDCGLGTWNFGLDISHLVVEKLPFFALAFCSSITTFLVQKAGGAVLSLESIPLLLRIINALMAYLRYISHTVLPVGLAPFYPYETHWPLLAVLGAGLFLAGLSFLCLAKARRYPYLPVGWFWFLGTLVPTIGLVQVGVQSMADRYMYIPSIGLFILVVWGLCDLRWPLSLSVGREGESCQADESLKAQYGFLPLPFRRGEGRGEGAVFPSSSQHKSETPKLPTNQLTRNASSSPLTATHSPSPLLRGEGSFGFMVAMRDSGSWWLPTKRETLLAGAGLLAVAAYLVCTCIQLGYWQNAGKLFEHALQVNSGCYLAYACEGKTYEESGQKQLALACYSQAVRLAPHYVDGQYNLGTLLLEMGQTDEAIKCFKRAITDRPNFPRAHNNLGKALRTKGDLPAAIDNLRKTVELDPDWPEAHYNLGTALLTASKIAEATTELSEALRLDPNYAGAHMNLAVAFVQQNKPELALNHFAQAARLAPNNPEAHFNYGLALLEQNRPGEAVVQFAVELRLRPEEAKAHYRMAVALVQLNKPEDAILQYRETLRLAPDFTQARDELACLNPGD